MKTVYKRDINDTYITIEVPEFYKEDYQLAMLRNNRITGLLEPEGWGVDECSQYSYNISGMISMKAMFEKAKVERDDMELFVVQLVEVIRELKRYMLNANRLLLNEEYIFYQKGQFWFCYLPTENTPLELSFHRLTEYFVSQVNYEEKEGIHLAYELHKATMEENFDIGQIMEDYKAGYEKRHAQEVEVEEGLGNVFQISEESEWDIEKTEDILCEESGGFHPVRNIMGRVRKTRWGRWEGLIVDSDGQEERTIL